MPEELQLFPRELPISIEHRTPQLPPKVFYLHAAAQIVGQTSVFLQNLSLFWDMLNALQGVSHMASPMHLSHGHVPKKLGVLQ